MIGQGAEAGDILVLDNTNGYLVELEPGAFIEQPEFELTFGYITGVGLEFAIGTSDVAVFPGVSQIGGGSSLDGNSPGALVSGNLPFTIRVTGSGNLYDATLTYFGGSGSGTPPIPNNDAGAVFMVQPSAASATAAPEPASILIWTLLGLAMSVYLFSRR